MPGSRRSDRRRAGGHGNEGKGGGVPVIGNDSRTVARAERTAVFGKTKLCKFYILGVCTKGSDCCFAHDPSEMNPIPDLSRTKICKTLINTGSCDDPNCKYAHNRDELRSMPSAEQEMTQKPRVRPQANATAVSVPASAETSVPQVGTSEDQAAAQARMMQQCQWMTQMMMSQMMMVQQQEAQGNGGASVPYTMPMQPAGGGTASPFLYNALFAGNAAQQATAGGAAVNAAPKAKAGAGSAANKKPVRMAKDAGKNLAAVCDCGLEFAAEALFCRQCGAQRAEVLPKQKYGVKNTFVDVQSSPQSSKNCLAKAQSDPTGESFCLGGYSPLSTAQEKPDSLSMLPSTAEVTKSPASGLGMGLTSSSHQRLPRGSSWASGLGKVAEEESPKEEDTPTAHSGNTPIEKREQDTPFGSSIGETLQVFGDADEGFNAYTHGEAADVGFGSTEGALTMDMDSIRVKNTFIEFKPEAPRSGMRMVQTAAGRLDMMGASE